MAILAIVTVAVAVIIVIVIVAVTVTAAAELPDELRQDAVFPLVHNLAEQLSDAHTLRVQYAGLDAVLLLSVDRGLQNLVI